MVGPRVSRFDLGPGCRTFFGGYTLGKVGQTPETLNPPLDKVGQNPEKEGLSDCNPRFRGFLVAWARLASLVQGLVLSVPHNACSQSSSVGPGRSLGTDAGQFPDVRDHHSLREGLP